MREWSATGLPAPPALPGGPRAIEHQTMQTEATGAVRAAAALPEGAPALPLRISWGAVLAGGIAAAAIAATLNILGAAVGVTTVDAVGRATPGASSLGIGAAV